MIRTTYEHRLREALPYGERYAEQLRRDGVNVADSTAYQFACAAASNAVMREQSVDEVIERLWPELVEARFHQRAEAA